MTSEDFIQLASVLKQAGYSAIEVIRALAELGASAPKQTVQSVQPIKHQPKVLDVDEIISLGNKIAAEKAYNTAEKSFEIKPTARAPPTITMKASSSALIQSKHIQTPAGFKGSTHRTSLNVEYITINGVKTPVKALYRYARSEDVRYLAYLALEGGGRMNYLCDEHFVAYESDRSFHKLYNRLYNIGYRKSI